jgi:hypothetical protein
MRLPEITFHLVFAIQLSIGKFTYGKGGSFLRLITSSKIQKALRKEFFTKKKDELPQHAQSTPKMGQLSR